MNAITDLREPTVYLVDDDPAIRDSLGLLLETDGLRVEPYACAEDFLAAYNEARIGCIVLDVRMQRLSGIELHGELVRRGSHLPVIFLTAHGDIPTTVRAMKAGAVDFLTKPVNAERLIELVRAALQNDGERVLQRRRLAELTPRELEILRLVVAGQSSKNIARTLGISFRTVEVHRSKLLHKTGATSAFELAQIVAASGNGGDSPPPAADGG